MTVTGITSTLHTIGIRQPLPPPPNAVELHTLPIIAGLVAVDEALGRNYRLLQGLSAETSGGLLVALPSSAAEAFTAECFALSGKPAWIVGRVIEGDRTARIVESARIIEA